MNHNKRVVWEEGLFVRPQHFQQESRYLKHYANQRIDQALPFMHGLTDIEFEALFNVCVAAAAGLVVLLQHQHLLAGLGHDGGHRQAADAAAHHHSIDALRQALRVKPCKSHHADIVHRGAS